MRLILISDSSRRLLLNKQEQGQRLAAPTSPPPQTSHANPCSSVSIRLWLKFKTQLPQSSIPKKIQEKSSRPSRHAGRGPLPPRNSECATHPSCLWVRPVCRHSSRQGQPEISPAHRAGCNVQNKIRPEGTVESLRLFHRRSATRFAFPVHRGRCPRLISDAASRLYALASLR